MAYSTVKVAFFCLAFVGLIHVNRGLIIKSERVTNWGPWGPWDWCPDGEVAVGFEIRVEAFKPDRDNTGLTAIQLHCDKPDSRKDKNTQIVIQSSYKTWGTLRGYNACPGNGYIQGFELKVQPPAPAPPCKDDTSVDDFNAYCRKGLEKSDLSVVKGNVGDKFPESKWRSPKLCPMGHAVCGIRTQVEEYQGWEPHSVYCTDGDDSALNNVDMYCCYLGTKLAGGLPDHSQTRPT